jgi:hypothetical protein
MRKFLLLVILPFSLKGSDMNAFNSLDLRQPHAINQINKIDGCITSKTLSGLKIQFETNIPYPGIIFTFGKSFECSDWRCVGGVAFEIKNPNKSPIAVNVRIDDAHSFGTPEARSGLTKIPAYSTNSIIFPMPSTFSGMMLPPSELANSNGKPWNFYGPNLNESDVRSFSLFLAHPKNPTTLYLKSITWLPKPNMKGWIDQYGQNARSDWPGKITTNKDFQKQNREELVWLHGQPPSPGLDRYGGWRNGPQLAKSRFFRTALVGNGGELPPPPYGVDLPPATRWWLVTPEGHLFFSIGIDCANYGEETSISGRESWFQSSPYNQDRDLRMNFFQQNLQKKFGDQWKSVFTERTLARLKAWGFNTLGNWCDPAFYQSHQLPYTKCLGYQHPPMITPQCSLPDFFHPDFPKLVGDGLANGVRESKNDPWCIGYFVDNELCWDTWEHSGLEDQGAVVRAALSSPPGTPAREALMSQLKSRYTSLDAFNTAWAIHLTDWNQQMTLTAKQLTPAANKDSVRFLHRIAKRYYSVIASELKKADPNHLYLGSRLNQRPMPVVKAAAKYCDVISFNVYTDSIDPDAWAFLSSMGKPAIIGEFHFTSADRGMFPGRMTRASQKQRASAFTHYVKSVAAHPSFVGCHWFQYIDEPITGRWFDTENYPIGFVSVSDEPYHEMIKSSRKLLSEIYKPQLQ